MSRIFKYSFIFFWSAFVLTPLSQEEANRRKAASDAKAKQDLEDIARSEAAQLAAKKLTIANAIIHRL
mgnify:CR=1 FL=1